jgi:hypothetical protein
MPRALNSQPYKLGSFHHFEEANCPKRGISRERHIRHLFIAPLYVPHLSKKQRPNQFRLSLSEQTVMERLPQIQLSPTVIFATNHEFGKLQTTLCQFCRPAFNRPQPRASDEALRRYARHLFVIMNIIDRNAEIEFQFHPLT